MFTKSPEATWTGMKKRKTDIDQTEVNDFPARQYDFCIFYDTCAVQGG